MNAGFDPMVAARQAVSLYLRTHPVWYAYDDMLSDASYGVTLALKRWDPEKGPLRWYARRRATGAIIDGFRERSHIPRSVWVTGSNVDDYPDHQRAPLSIEGRALGGQDPGCESRELRAVEARVVVEALMAGLNARQRLVVAAVDLDGVPQTEVAAHLGVTAARVSQLHARAHQLMRAAAGEGDILLLAS